MEMVQFRLEFALVFTMYRPLNLLILLASLSSMAAAGTIPTIGPNSAVQVPERQATFDALNYLANGADIGNYAEGGLVVQTSGDNWAGNGPASPPFFDPFHTGGNPATQGLYFPDGGTTEWTTIKTNDSVKIRAIEFLYGNGWTTGDVYGVPWGNSNAWLEWQTLNGSTITSSGVVGDTWQLGVGTVVGFWNPDGFDKIRFKCRIANAWNPAYQTLALDNLKVRTSAIPAIIGTVQMHDWVAPVAGEWATIELRSGSTVVESIDTQLDAAGGFSVLPTSVGTFSIGVKMSHFIRYSYPNQSVGMTPITGLNFSLPNGDADNSGEVDAADIDFVISHFGETSGGSPYNFNADLDGSGEVDAVDIDIAIMNFGAVDP